MPRAASSGKVTTDGEGHAPLPVSKIGRVDTSEGIALRRLASCVHADPTASSKAPCPCELRTHPGLLHNRLTVKRTQYACSPPPSSTVQAAAAAYPLLRSHTYFYNRQQAQRRTYAEAHRDGLKRMQWDLLYISVSTQPTRLRSPHPPTHFPASALRAAASRLQCVFKLGLQPPHRVSSDWSQLPPSPSPASFLPRRRHRRRSSSGCTRFRNLVTTAESGSALCIAAVPQHLSTELGSVTRHLSKEECPVTRSVPLFRAIITRTGLADTDT